MDINTAFKLARIAERARTLLHEDGYMARPSPETGIFFIYQKGASIADYVVDANTEFCSCRCWEEMKTCKHLQAVEAMLREEDEQIRRWEADEYGRLAMQSDAAEHFIGV